MRITLFILSTVLLICFNSCTNNVTQPDPVNPHASPEARALLKFLYNIQGKYTLSRQHNYISTGSKYTDEVFRITGKYPIVWGSDFSFFVEGENYARFQHCGPANLSDPADSAYFLDMTIEQARQNMINEIIRKHREGYIITLMWHGCFPTEGDQCQGNNIWAMENRPSPETWKELVTEGTELNKAWKKQVDNIAGYLKQLQEAKIPILWRPYHEMNGVWFWWCNHKGGNGFPELWRMMYRYFTDYHELNNLIWVWNTNAPRDRPGDEAFDYELFYPGDEYVDILAADVYRNDYKQSHHDDLRILAEGKPIVLGEVGGLPAPEILDAQPYWEWFMSWGYLLILSNSEEAIIELYNSPRVLTLDEVKLNEDGTIEVR
jgi:mannan endo-1,4-beta-mannosidase